jgi:RNA polymerase sigma-70 factor (ECF subfamily)
LLHDQGEAEDVAQETFARVYYRLKDFEHTGSFGTWLHRIVINISIDTIRRRRRQHRSDVDDSAAPEEMPGSQGLWPRPDTSHPGANAERRELRKKLQQAFDGLPEIHQAVLLLRELEGLSYDEIARVLGIKKGTVMSRLFHARRTMQARFIAIDEDAQIAPGKSTGA